VLKRAEAALATAPAPAERAAPPAATIPPAFAVAAAPTAAPALKRNKNLNININVSKALRAIYKKYLREGGHWLPKYSQDPPYDDGHAHQTGDAPQR
jgi:hypothetical protein